jgi:5-methylcytosine-specific restriction enzyme subunit McrC
VIATPTLIVNVEPKIPAHHLVYLLERASLFPRLDADPATLAPDAAFFELVARWYMRRLHRLLEEGLARDYRPTRDEIRTARGRISPLATASLYYRGRMTLVAEYDEFDFDTPLNRLLLEAARLLLANSSLGDDIRLGARRAIAHMDGIGDMRGSDIHAAPERRTSHYRDAALLAKQIIRGTGRALLVGDRAVWTFLIRTPLAVEAGLRNALAGALPPARAHASGP